MNKKKETILRRILVVIIAIAVVTTFGLSYASDSVMKATSIPEDAIMMEAEAAEESGLAEETQEMTLPSDGEDAATQESDEASGEPDADSSSGSDSDQPAGEEDSADGADAEIVIGEAGQEDAAGDATGEAADDTEAADTEETEDVAMPAQSFTGQANGVTVSVEADEGTFPADTTMKVTTVAHNDVFDAVQEAVDGEVASIKAVDITFYDKEGNEIQPEKEVRVAFRASGMDESAQHDVVHIDNEGTAEVINDAQIDGNNAEIATDSFSIYVIVTVEPETVVTNQITYEFQNADGTPHYFQDSAGNDVNTQIIKDGEKLIYVQTPEIEEGENFKGWYVYDVENEKWGEKISFNTAISVTETKTVIVRPYVNEVTYVTFYENAAGTVILNRFQVTKGSEFEVSLTVPAQKAGMAFAGWSETPGTDGDEREYINNTSITVEESTSFYPVFKSAHWITFYTAATGSGATYFAPVSVLADGNASTAKPATNPVWKGHAFEGWSVTPDADPEKSARFTAFNFNQILKKDTTLYAQWTAGQGTYNVVYWKQNVSDDKNATKKTYSFDSQTTKSATVGSKVYASTYANAEEGFVYNADKSDKEITVNADGTSVLNVYFDRKLITMRFYEYGTNGPSSGYSSSYWTNGSSRVKVFTGLYGQSLAQNGYTWPEGMHTYYYNNGRSTMGMSYLGQFILPDELFGKDEIRLYYTGNPKATIEFYLQNADGTYNNTATDTGASSGGNFNLSEKYNGYSVAQYRRYTGTHNWIDSDWITASSGTQVQMSGYSTYYNLAVRYQLKKYDLNYLDSVDGTALTGIPAQSVRFNESLKSYQPGDNIVPISSTTGKVWDGKWYKDQACTEEFDWNDVMPNADLNVYAGWKDVWYWVKIDPNGGALTEGESTYFWETYGETVEQYGDISRNFSEDENGTWYYHYDEFNTALADHDGTQPAGRKAYYTENKSESTDGKTYKQENNAYALIGWYDITSGIAKPYNFASGVTGNLILQAKWRKVGEYKVSYMTEAVDAQAKPLLADDESQILVSDVPQDGNTYADKSDAVVGKAPTVPEGYTFMGWYYTPSIHQTGDVFEVDSALADQNKTVYLYPVLAKTETLTAELTQITYDGNGGYNGSNESVTTYANLQNNKPITLSDQGFTRPGYTLVGWSTSKDALDANAITARIGETVGVDTLNKENNVLYAVWKINTHDVTITKEVVSADSADQTKPFAFRYSLNGEEQSTFLLAGAETEVQTESGTVTVPTSYVIPNVPYGTEIVISEENTGCETTVNGEAYSGSYTYTVGAEDGTIAFVNNMIRHNVTLTKTFEGLSGEQIEALTGFAVTNTYNEETFTLDSAEVDGQTYSWTIPNVPYGTTITFTEQGYDAPEGYYRAEAPISVSATVEGEDVALDLTNTYEEKKEITVTAKSDTAVYDGKSHEVSGFEALEVTVDGAVYTVQGLSANASGTNAGTYETEISGTAIVKDANGKNVTDQFIVNTENGTLTISPRELTVTTEGGTKPYDGTALSVEGATVTGLVDGDVVTATANGSQTEVGSSANSYTIDWNETRQENYTVKENLGTLEITTSSVAVVLTAPSASKTYDGTALTADGSGANDEGNAAGVITASGLPTGFTIEATATGTQTDAGSSANEIADDYKIFDTAGNDQTASFTNITLTAGMLTVNPAPLVITTGSASKAYDGSALTGSDASATGLVNGETITVTATGSLIEVGSTQNTYEIDWGRTNPDNYVITENLGLLTIAQSNIEVTLTAPSAVKTYDGTALVADGSEEETDGVIYPGTGNQVIATGLPTGFYVEATLEGSQTDAGESKNHIADGFVIRDASGNDRTANFTNVERIDGTLTVNPAPVTIKTGSGSKAYDGTALTNAEVSIEGLAGEEQVTLETTGTIEEVGSTENTYTIDWSGAKKENYTMTENLGTLTITANSAQVTLTAPSASRTYNGKPLTAVGTGEAKVTAEGLPKGFTVEATASGAQTDVGEGVNAVNDGYVIKNAAGEDKTANFTNVTLVDGTLTVTPKAAIVTSGSGSKAYDGIALTNTNVTITGLVDGESVTLQTTGSQTEVGSSTNTYAITWDNATEGNYTLTESLGTLTVTENNTYISLTAPSAEKTYDGTALSDATVKAEGLPEGFTVEATASGSQTDAGKSANTVNSDYIIRNADGADQTASFTNINLVAGTLKVNPAPVTITTGSGEKAYDGVALINEEASIEGLAGEETVTLTATGSITEIGTTANTYAIEWDGANASNYQITENLGTLSITANSAQVTLTAASAEQIYNGLALTANDVTAEGLPAGFHVEAKAEGTQTDAGSSENVVAADYVIKNALGEDKTVSFTNIETVNGTLTVTPKAVTVRTGSATGLYSGQPLTNDEASIEGLIETEAESITIKTTGTITEVGETDNTYEIAWGSINSKNYEITDELGTLSVVENDGRVLLTAPSATKVYDGTELTVNAEDIVAEGLPAGFYVEATVTGAQTDAGVSSSTINNGYKIYNADGEDRTASFTNIERVDGTLTVTKKAVTITTGSGEKAYDGTPLTSEEATIEGLVEGEEVTLTATGTITEMGSTPNTYDITWDSAKEDNYSITEKIGTLTVTINDAEVVLAAPSAEQEYNGIVLTAAEVTASGLPEGFTISATATGSQLEAGTSENPVADGFMIYNADGEDRTSSFANVTRVPGSLTVTKKAVTITTGSGEKEYDGAPVTNAEAAIDGLVDGESVTVSATGSQTEVGSSANTYAITWNGANAGNYEITETLGTLTVSENTSAVVLTAASDEKAYDGTVLNNHNVTASGLPAGFSISASAAGSIIDAGSAANVVEPGWKIFDGFGNDRTDNFTNVTTQNGQLTIHPIPATVTTGTKTMLYDGTPLTDPTAEITGLIDGEQVGIHATGSQTEVGTVTNGYEITWGSINPNNYTITEKLGTLTVVENSGQILLHAPNAEKVYDGTALTADGKDGPRVTADGLPAGFTVEATASGSQTNAGESANVVDDGYIIRNAAGVDKTANYTNVTKVDGTLRVLPKEITVTTGSGQKAYDGVALTEANAVVTGLVNGETVTATATGAQTEVGESTNTYTMDWGMTRTGNYTVKEDLGKLTVTQNSGKITLTAASAAKTYDGNTLTDSSVSAAGLPAGFTCEATASGSQTDAGTSTNSVNGGFAIYNAAGEDRTDSFTNIVKGDGTLTVSPAPVTITTGAASKAYDGTALTSELAEITGLATGEQVALKATGTITEVGSTDNTYAIEWTQAKEGNYTVTENLGKLTITESDAEVVLTAPSATKIYDGSALSADGSNAVTAGITYQNAGNKVIASGLPTGFTVEASATGTQTEAGTSENIVNGDYIIRDASGKDQTKSFTKVVTVPGTLTVNPAPVLVTTGSNTKAYDGTPLMEQTAEITGLVDGETATVIATGSRTEIGSTPNTYSINWETAKAENYTVTEDPGTLTIIANPAEITLTAGSGEKVYDGAALENKNVLANGLPAGFYITAAATGSQTDAGSAENTVNDGYIIHNAAGTDKTDHFINIRKVAGTLTVSKRPVTVSSESDSKIYDGKPLTCDKAAIEGLVKGETVTLHATGTLTEVGNTPNVCEITWDNATENNYTVTYNYGTLLVTKQDTDVILTAPSAEKVYDGTPLTTDDLGRVTAKGLPEGFTVDATATGSQTNAGESESIVNNDYVIRNADGDDRTDNFPNVVIVNGTLKVKPKDVTVTAQSHSFIYNGTEQSWNRYDVTGLVGEDALSATLKGSITFPRQSGMANIIESTAFTTGNPANYNVNLVPGTLTMANAAQAITVTAASDTWTYDGIAHANGQANLTEGTLFAGDTLTASATGSVTNVADTTENNNQIAAYVILHGDEDVTDNYVVNQQAGRLSILPRNITLSSADAEKEYDGSPLTTAEAENAGITVGADGFATGEGATYDVTGTRTTVGESDNTFGYTLADGTHAANYAIKVQYGKLRITNRTDKPVITVSAESGEFLYDGAEKSLSALTNLKFADNGQVYTIEGLKASVAETNAGIYANKITGTAVVKDKDGNDVTDQFTIETVDGFLRIDPRQITLTSASDAQEYNGRALTNAEVTVTGDGFVEGEGASYDVTGSQTAVGSSENAFTYKLNAGTNADNYEIKTIFGTLNVTNRSAKYTIDLMANSLTTQYDGTEKNVSGLTDTHFAVDGNTYTVSGMTAEAKEVHAGTYPVNITGTPVVRDAKGNDVTEQFAINTIAGTLTITKRQLTMTSETAQKMYDGNTLTAGEIMVTGDGFADGEGAAYHVTGSRTLAGTVENAFTYTLNEGTLADDYNIKTVFGTLTILNRPDNAKYEITVQAASDTQMYDGTEKTVSGLTDVAAASSTEAPKAIVPNGEPFAVVLEGNTYYVTGLKAEASATDAGTYTVPVIGTPVVADEKGNDVTEQFIVHTKPGTLTITPRKLTMTSASDARRYNGKTLMNDRIDVTGDGFAEGEGASYEVTGAQTLAGRSDNTFTYTLNNGTKAENYQIETVFGTLTVNSRDAKYEITVAANSLTAQYDGTEKKVTGLDTLTFTVEGNTYTVEGLVAEATGTDAGTYQALVKGTPFVYDADHNDVTAEFAVSTRSGELVITPRKLTMTSGSASRMYDGTPLTKEDVTVTGDGFVEGESAIYQFSGSRTLAGSAENTFAYTLTGGAKAENYVITTEFGQLTVTDRDEAYDIVLQPNGAEFTYDGTQHEAIGFAETTFVVNGVTYTVEGVTVYAEGTDAGTYPMNVSGTPVVRDADGNDVTAQFNVTVEAAYLTINPRTVTLISADAEKEYNGIPLTTAEEENAGVTVGGEGFVEGEGATYDVTGSQLNVGSSENKFTYTLNEGTKTGNYQIETVFGTLTVSSRVDRYLVNVAAPGGTFTYDGTLHSVSGLQVASAAEADDVQASISSVDDSSTSGAGRIVPNGRALTVRVDGNTYYIRGLYAERTGVDAGTYDVTVNGNAVVEDVFGNDVTDQFTVNTTDSQMTIEKRKLTMTSGSASHTYNGRAITNAEITVTEDGFANGEGATYDVTGSQTLVGMSENMFTYMLDEGTNPENYEISTAYGLLNVLGRDAKYQITLTPNSATYQYDGTEKSVEGFVNTRFTLDDMEYEVSGLTAEASGIDPGTYAVTVNGTPIVTDENGNDVSSQFAVNVNKATLTIVPVEAVITPVPTDGGTQPTEPGVPGGPNTPTTDTNRLVYENGTVVATGAQTVSAVADGAGEGVTSDTPDTENVTFGIEEVEDDTVPVAPFIGGYWALINLICAIAGFILLIIMLIVWFFRSDDDEEEEQKRADAARTAAEADAEEEEDDKRRRRKLVPRILTAVLAVAAIIVFIITEDMTKTMQLVDQFTILMIILFAAEAILAIASRKKKKKQEEEEAVEA